MDILPLTTAVWQLLEADAHFAHALAALVEAGALAQIPCAKAIGQGEVMIEGDVGGSTIITGDNNEAGM